MFKKWIEHIVEGKTYYGLEVFELDGKAQFSVLKLEKKKGELHVISEILTEKLEELPAYINKKNPLFLTLNTAQVLKKEISEETKDNHELLVVNAFPNLELDNFYYQILSSKENGIVAISKKEYVDWYLEQLEKLGVKPFSIVLGVAQIDTLGNFLKDSVQGSNFNVVFDKGLLVQFTSRDEFLDKPIDVNGLTIGNNQLLSFSHILNHLQKIPQISNLGGKNNIYHNDFKNARIFDFGFKTALGFFLVVLLGNFLVYNHYVSKNDALEASLASEELQSTAFQKLKERVLVKEERVKKLSNSKNSKTTFFFDELGKRLPSSIWLSEMQYQPLLSPVQAEKTIDIGKNNLQISGITNDKIAFTVWSDNLEMQKWADRVEIIDYEYISNTSANFTINVILNEAH